MKKIISLILIAVLIGSCSITAFAAEADLDDENRQTDIGVYAQYVDNTGWNTLPVDETGEASIVLPDGTEITVSGVADTQWRLVVDPVTEQAAIDWIHSILDSKAQDLTAFHIYFIDGNGNTKAADGVTVTIKLPKKLANPVAYSLTSEGKDSSLTVTVKDGKITFSTDGSPFYVLGQKVTGGTNTPGTGNSPHTGDDTNLWLWVALMLISIAGLTATLCYSKKRKAGK